MPKRNAKFKMCMLIYFYPNPEVCTKFQLVRDALSSSHHALSNFEQTVQSFQPSLFCHRALSNVVKSAEIDVMNGKRAVRPFEMQTPPPLSSDERP